MTTLYSAFNNVAVLQHPAAVAQLAEHLPRNEVVGGSIPPRRAIPQGRA